jgi:hypothetical protein
VQPVTSLPRPQPIRFELTGVEVHLKLLDEESGEALDGLGLRVDGHDGIAVRWMPGEGAYVFGPVEPGTVGLVHGSACRVDVHVDPREAEGGVLRRELRVRGFPRRVASEGEE